MSIEDNTRIVQNIHPFFNERAFDRILSEMIRRGHRMDQHSPTAQMFHGLEGMREFMQGWADAFPDATTGGTTAYAGEEFGVTELIGGGTHGVL